MSDLELLGRIRSGDQSALEELFGRYYHSLCNFTFQYVRDFQLTEEIVSDVFLKIWMKRDDLDIQSNFKAYLFTATRNQALNYLRKDKEEHVSFDDVDNEVEDHTFSPDKSIREREVNDHLENLINVMPDRRAQVFRLSRIDGFTYKEIGRILSISKRTVQNHMVKAVKQLSKLVEKK